MWYLCGRRFKYGIVEVRFSTKKEAGSHATMILRSGKMHLLPVNKERRSVRLRIGRIITAIETEWVAVAILSTKENSGIISVSRINNLNWWGYGIEIWLLQHMRI